MLVQREVERLGDAALLVELRALVKADRATMVRLLVHLAEVQARGLFRERGYGSMFEYCVAELGMSEDEAWTRIRAARVGKSFPLTLGMIARGELHLTGLRLIGPHLNEGNCAELLARVRGKRKREIEVLVAELAPQADVESRIRRTPSPLGPGRFKVEFTVTDAMRLKLERLQELSRHRTPNGDLGVILEPAVDLLIAKRERERFGKTAAARAKASAGSSPPCVSAPVADRTNPSDGSSALCSSKCESRGTTAREGSTSLRTIEPAPPRPKAVDCAGWVGEPRSARVPAGRGSSAGSVGEPGPVRAEAGEGLGSRYIPRQVRREVAARDEERCTFVGVGGKRCGERAFLEFHHETAFAWGGSSSLNNLRLLCRAHNGLYAERDFGRKFMATKRPGPGASRG